MSRRTFGLIALGVGLGLLAVSLLADRISLGGMPGVFGWKQMLGAGVGLLILMVGALIARERGDMDGGTEDSLALYDTASARHYIFDELREVLAYRDLLVLLVDRNLTARYKRSALGVLWTLLDPLLTMLVMAVIYTALFQTRIPGYPVFLLCGLIAWNLFAQGSYKAMADLTSSGGLIGKVYLPKSIFGVAAVFTAVVNLAISLVVLSVFMVAFNLPFTVSLLSLPVVVLVSATFTLGVGLAMSALAVFFSDMLNIHAILTRLLMYLSGVFYLVEDLPARMQWLVKLTPTYHMVELFRSPTYGGQWPSLTSLAYLTVWAVVAFGLGAWIFTRLSDAYAYRI